jgi:hypothetical protein
MHFSKFTVSTSFRESAPKGHASTQVPQAVQFASTTLATYPEEASAGIPYFTIASIPAQQHLQQLQIA